ncbi:lipid droplet-associated hydrolase isoform X1 [Aphis gossypii]|uniref:lipid droplet-associated hydrolase isoform X1 n=2 Tax=Aphis gossypii TaxID=80765 RepID=UPI002158B43C|nr:lipid droplet-associated hydrolase isoform X1 [Aphis gossypii]
MAVSYRVAATSLYPRLPVFSRYRRATTVFVGRLPRKHDGIGTDRRHYHQDMTTVTAEESSATVAKMRSTTADDDSGRSMKATDLWVDVNGVATRVLCWGQSINDDNRHELKRVVLCVCGNPGITEFYEKFLQEVYRTLNVPVWVLSHAGHEVPPSNSEHKIPDPKMYPDLYTLKGQVEHKLRFIEKYVPDNCDLYLVGHSIGSKIISELLKDSTMAQRLSVKRSVFLFPTLQKMRETPNGRKLIFTASNFLSITIFLSWIFTTFPAFIKTFLVNVTLMIMEGGQVDDHVIRSAVRLVHPMVLRNVFSMAVDEMDKVYELDNKPLKDNAKRLYMYFGKTDDWCPTSFYDDISKCVPEAETVLCDKGYQHAFVIGYSDEMAGIVCDWLQPDLEDAKSH